jgi:hypothetical protein
VHEFAIHPALASGRTEKGLKPKEKGPGKVPRPYGLALGPDEASVGHFHTQFLVRAAIARPASQSKVASPMKGKSTM